MKMKKLKRWISYHNPLGTWYKVRHWFKIPKAVFYFGIWYGGGTGLDFRAPWWKLIEFSCKLIPRGKNGIEWEHEDVYWETILNIIYYDMSLLDAIENNTWSTRTKSDNFESRKKENVYTEKMLTDEGEREMFYLIAKRAENNAKNR